MIKKSIKLTSKQQEIVDRYRKQTDKDCYRIEIEKSAPSYFDSNLGGLFYLPVGEEHPKTKSGNYMSMFIQLNFEGLRLQYFPVKGIFQLFINPEHDYPLECQIRYYHYISKDFQRDLKIIKNDFRTSERMIKLSLVKDRLPMPVTDRNFEYIILPMIDEVFNTNLQEKERGWWDNEDYKNIESYLNQFRTGITVGGYGDTTQMQSFDYVNEKVLFKIDSCGTFGNDIMIGDVGIMWATITNQDLSNGDLEKAEVDWDCH